MQDKKQKMVILNFNNWIEGCGVSIDFLKIANFFTNHHYTLPTQPNPTKRRENLFSLKNLEEIIFIYENHFLKDTERLHKHRRHSTGSKLLPSKVEKNLIKLKELLNSGKLHQKEARLLQVQAEAEARKQGERNA